MDLMHYLRVFRHRWPLLLIAVGVGLLMSWLTLPPATQEGVPRAQSYQATATVIASPSSPQPLTMSTVALYATAGQVPVRAAQRVNYDGEPQVLASTITATVGDDQRTLTISTSSTDGPLAARTVNAFAEELVAHFENDKSSSPQGQLEDVNADLRVISGRIADLDRRIADRPNATQLQAERGGLQTQYQALSQQAATLRSQAAGSAPLILLQRAVPIPETEEGVFKAPTSGPIRMLIGAWIGLLLGLALALLVERADSRIRTREDAEEAFDLPVLSEIPRLPRSRRGEHVILSAVEPGSATAEAHRALRSTLLLLRPGDPTQGGRQHPTEPNPLFRGTTLLVTSPRPSEGKTTTVANLAVVLAESGRSVLILSLDLRSPDIQEYFGIPELSGLSDILHAGRPQDLENIVRDTEYPGVRVAPGGRELAHAGGLLAGVKPLLEHARQLADVVLVDSPPILTVSDALEISPHVDAALVISRAGRTTRAQAVATNRLISRLGVPALGTVLVAAEEVPGSYRYGYGYGYGKSSRRRAEEGAETAEAGDETGEEHAEGFEEPAEEQETR
jgi:capsular exopolysaccharide synthesis family protein